MARIPPVSESELSVSMKEAFEKHVQEYKGRITNMKATLAHSQLAFEVYMQWYPLYEKVEEIVGKRLAYLFAYSISYASDCPLCSVFFRKIIIDAGEQPETIELTEQEKRLIDLGSSIAKHHGHVDDDVYDPLSKEYSKKELVILIAFAGQMIATNIFNNVIGTDIDEYLKAYLPPFKSNLQNV
jgi:hypothetical protein